METIEKSYQPKESFLRVATACPEMRVGNVSLNTERILELYQEAETNQAQLVVFPELSLTGYTLGDLVQQKVLLREASAALESLAIATADKDTAMIVGAPLELGNGLYNCAAILSKGQIQGVVPKINLPNYKEFYEKRWFQSWDQPNSVINIGGKEVPFGTDMLFQIAGAKLGIEICEDLWAMQPPSERLAAAGATIIANPSASPEQVSKSAYRRQLVGQQSARLLLAYLYAGCDASESTMDIVMSGHQLISENGHLLAERPPLTIGQRITMADVDLDHLQNDRRKDTNVPNNREMPVIDCDVAAGQAETIRYFDASPFVPKGPETNVALKSILDIQAQGLASRVAQTHREKVFIGLSGGLDSTLALIAAVNAAKRLGREPSEMIRTLTLPGEASSEHTQSNAVLLSEALGIPNEVIPIGDLAQDQLRALSHDGITEDTTYENVQARLRTSLILNRVNQVLGSMMVGTGDLSEIALGWCTFNADDRSHYNVNTSIPKTLVRHLVAYAAEQPAFESARKILQSIIDTPISPELTGANSDGITQNTEDILGPYELHDFFLYHFIRWNDEPEKIAYIANIAFNGKYSQAEINKCLTTFLSRFMSNQWKRSVATDGPKVGSVSLSPRGDWRMPSDMSGRLWLDKLQ